MEKASLEDLKILTFHAFHFFFLYICAWLSNITFLSTKHNRILKIENWSKSAEAATFVIVLMLLLFSLDMPWHDS